VAQTRTRAGWGSVLVGLASVATIPVAVYATRFSASYDLLHAGFAIPVAVALAIFALALARRARLHTSVSLAEDGNRSLATAGRVLGIMGLCMAAAALVSLGVFQLLEYVGTRD
jgi:hypothetical protein